MEGKPKHLLLFIKKKIEWKKKVQIIQERKENRGIHPNMILAVKLPEARESRTKCSL